MNKNYDDFTIIDCITNIIEEKEGYYLFKDTIFFGEKGGMKGDKGTINGLEVKDLKWDGDKLYHKVDGILSDPITMHVDKETRFMNTAVQSVLHLLDGYYAKLNLYLSSVGVNLENQWYEVNSKDISVEDLLKVQEFINDIIHQDIKMNISYMNGRDYPDEFYHQFETLRLISFGDINTQPCGTLHVNKTSQIESFQILDYEKNSRGTRVYFTCNHMTNNKLLNSYNLLKSCAQVCCVKKEELLEKVNDLLTNNKILKKELADLKKELIEQKALQLLTNNQKIIEYTTTDATEIRDLAQAMINKIKGTKAILSMANDVINFAIISSVDKARDILEQLKTHYSITGGGNNKIVTAKLSADKNEFIKALMSII